MAGYVVQQLEERERLKQKNERSHQERETIKEPPQDVDVDQLRKASAGPRQDFLGYAFTIHSVCRGGPCAGLRSAAAQQTLYGFEVGDRPHPLAFASKLLHTWQQCQP